MARTAGGGGGHKVYRRTPLRLRVPDTKTYPESSDLAEKMPPHSNDVTKGVPPPLDSRYYRVDPDDTTVGAELKATCRIEEVFKRHGVVTPIPSYHKTGFPRGVTRRTRRAKTSRGNRKQRYVRPFEARFNLTRLKKNLYIGAFDTIEEASLAHEVARKIITNAMIDHHEIEELDALISYAKLQALGAAEQVYIVMKSLQNLSCTNNSGASIGGDESAAGSSGSATIPSPLPTDDELDETYVCDANDSWTEKPPIEQSFPLPQQKDTNTGEDRNNVNVEGDDSIGPTGEASATTPSVLSLQHTNLSADQLLKAHAAGVVNTNDCWESTFISAFKLLPTDVILPCIDNPYWSGNARMLKLISTRQNEFDAAVVAESDLAQELIVRQIFMSLRLGSLATRFLVIVPKEILKIAGGPSDRLYWAVAGDNIALNEIRLELKRASLKQQDAKNWVQDQAAPKQEIAHDNGKSYGLAQVILDLMEEDIAGGDNNVSEQNTRNAEPTIEEDLPSNKSFIESVQGIDERKESAAGSHPGCTDSKNNGLEENINPYKANIGQRKAFRKCLTTIETATYEIEREEVIPEKATSHSKNEDGAEIRQKRKRSDGQPAAATSQSDPDGLSPQEKRSRKTNENNSTSLRSTSCHSHSSTEAPEAFESLKICVEVPSTKLHDILVSEEKGLASLPEHNHLLNFPSNISRNGRQSNGLSEDVRGCVMCGKVCPFGAAKNFPADAQVIPKQNRGICNRCDVKVWKMVELGFDIKFCKGCKNFRPWALFGGNKSKCKPCRNKASEKYAASKSGILL